MTAPEREARSQPEGPSRRLRVRNDPAELQRLHGWVEELSAVFALAPDVSFAADLCLQEAVGNVIAYAFRDGAPHQIGVSATLTGSRLTVEVEDDGLPFNPLTVPPPDRAGSLEHLRIGGLGIQLIRRFASATRYAREDNRNRLTIVIASDGARP